uniref:ATP-dependent Clp protease proteolytic subunit n=1 Tax=Astragalus stipulatus TaxID=2836193 RepID=A0AA96HBF2_9FABA|nr:ATP-dependent Clp protease proteolytic subunit [Astragalus stipulatus]WNM88830.1 ATP-dependent Clp protease proteolytic subunit [Astragalus stipulatus]
MPVGVPKVPYLVPGDEEASWIDLYNRLYQERALFLGQEVNSEISNQLVGLMVYLSLEDKTKDLYLFINSPGGEVVSGMAMFDAMHFVEAEVQTVCVGLAASMASLLLVGGVITKRLAFPHVMIHQPSGSLQEAQTEECMAEVDELINMCETITQIYAQRTGQPSWKISKDMERDFYMSAEEAQAYGIVDMVAE